MTVNTIKPSWNPLSIALMVLGFVLFWPLGLAMLAYILWGDNMTGWKREAKCQWDRSNLKNVMDGMQTTTRSGNAAFDDYREKELARLEEERKKLESMRKEFDDYMEDLRRAKDQDEFDRFMRNRHNRTGEPSAGDAI
ncbi:hypothetical protein PsAD2_01762 [Pseudovibrio axinellae]|uniref:DUF2852 domain-containing protein n=1 Tax=Pseudovibrio axinellae TaxID=989403 RepID=A0A165Z3S1_9HYPH|nr:DUF2852 domain-containing protein [Pseudovibrio axinellae]KZL19484.1 hypothetical protein PsAD2_01762 [Pseudovibrio axinellae]SEQ28717.1 Protein of unknown function [Pseudovibrio axinellae]